MLHPAEAYVARDAMADMLLRRCTVKFERGTSPHAGEQKQLDPSDGAYTL